MTKLNQDKINSKLYLIRIHIKFLLICGFIVLIAVINFNFYQNYDKTKIDAKRFDNNINKLNNQYAGDVFIIPGWCLSFQFSDPLKKMPTFDFKKIDGGWTGFSPRFYQDVKNNLGVERGHEIIPAMIDNNKAFIIATDDFLLILSTYIDENYHSRAKLVKVDEVSKIGIYKIVSK